MATIHLTIKGKVQGVFFRASAKEAANDLGVTGWVKNMDDGNVEAVVTGSKEQIEKFVNWCKRGPAGSIVTAVHITYIEEAFFNHFEIRNR